MDPVHRQPGRGLGFRGALVFFFGGGLGVHQESARLIWWLSGEE